MARILVVDDESFIRNTIRNILEQEKHIVDLAEDAIQAFEKIKTKTYDLVITDIVMPNINGIVLLEKLKEDGYEMPIMIMSAHGNIGTAVDCIKKGAFDYIEKPLTHGEVLARIRVQLRNIEELNKARGMNPEESFCANGLCVDFKMRRVTVEGQKISLTKNEFMILALLCRYPDRVLTYDFIMESVWGPQISGGTGILRVNVANMRKKLEKNGQKIIHTENGVGYRVVV